MKKMQMTLKLEELGMFVLSIYAFSFLPFAWWWFPLLLFVPDVGLLGYLINPHMGSVIYNVFHNKIIAFILLVVGWYLDAPILQLTGIILFAHASMDRFLGYGLKYSDSFWHTHLDQI